MRRQQLGSVSRQQSRRWSVERLEVRWMLAVAWVTTELDVIDLDDDLISLREAILAANMLTGSDTIEFDASLAGKTIQLTRGELRITDDLVLNGLGSSQLAIDASGNDPTPLVYQGDGSRVLLVDDGDDESLITVDMRDLTVTGAADMWGAGGGIHNRENLRLNRVRIEGNSNWFALSASGGGIYSTLGRLEIAASVISGNISGAGGGIGVENGKLHVVDSEISNNLGDGAALYLSEAQATLKSTSIQGHEGVAIVSHGGRLDLDTCNFTDNGYPGALQSGISIHRGEARILRTVLARNFGTVISSFGGTVEIEHSSIVDNIGGNFGSAITHYDGELNVRSSTISGNSTYLSPSALNLYSSALIESSTISGNVGEFYAAVQIRLGVNEQVRFAHCTITNNRIEGLYRLSNFAYRQGSVGQVMLDHTIVSGNWFDERGDESEPVPSDIEGAITAFWSVIGEASIPVQGNNNLIGVDPRLGPLADNGGGKLPDGTPRLTHALLPDSPLVDRGDPAREAGVGDTPAFDQRDLPFGRTFGGRIDIGAIEWQPMPAAFHGDFNHDGVTDSADYSVWRDAVGRTGLVPYSGADGDGSGDVDQDDYSVWVANFGRVMAGGGGAAVGRKDGVARESAESSLPPALPGVLWTEQRVARADTAKDTGRDVLRRQPIQRSAAAVDRALVAWLASRAAIHEGANDTCDAATRQRDEFEAAEWDDAFDVFARRGNAVSMFASIECE